MIATSPITPEKWMRGEETAHPEQRDDEYLLTNEFIPNYRPNDLLDVRTGYIAYDKNGGIIPHTIPIFVKKKDYDKLNTMRGYKRNG